MFATEPAGPVNPPAVGSIVNVVESTIARNSDWVLPIHAGPEIGVASTKAFLGQLIVLYILTLKLAIYSDEYSSFFQFFKFNQRKLTTKITKR